MACLEMYNSSDEHQTGGSNVYYFNSCSSMSPRISFSNDFVEIKPESSSLRNPLVRPEGSPASPSDNFEFSVTNYSMMSADELFFKGKLLPFKESKCVRQRTLREELLVGEEDDDDDGGFSLRPPKGSWRGLLGLKRAHIGSKRAEKTISSHEEMRFGESKSFGFVHQEAKVNKTPQELLGEGGSNCRDVEIGT